MLTRANRDVNSYRDECLTMAHERQIYEIKDRLREKLILRRFAIPFGTTRTSPSSRTTAGLLVLQVHFLVVGHALGRGSLSQHPHCHLCGLGTALPRQGPLTSSCAKILAIASINRAWYSFGSQADKPSARSGQ